MLATLKTHGCSTNIFNPDYTPPKKTSVTNPTISEDVLALLSNSDGLFTSVPKLSIKQLKKAKLSQLQTPYDRAAAEIQRQTYRGQAMLKKAAVKRERLD